MYLVVAGTAALASVQRATLDAAVPRVVARLQLSAASARLSIASTDRRYRRPGHRRRALRGLGPAPAYLLDSFSFASGCCCSGACRRSTLTVTVSRRRSCAASAKASPTSTNDRICAPVTCSILVPWGLQRRQHCCPSWHRRSALTCQPDSYSRPRPWVTRHGIAQRMDGTVDAHRHSASPRLRRVRSDHSSAEHQPVLGDRRVRAGAQWGRRLPQRHLPRHALELDDPGPPTRTRCRCRGRLLRRWRPSPWAGLGALAAQWGVRTALDESSTS
jgi:hypothetical protein